MSRDYAVEYRRRRASLRRRVETNASATFVFEYCGSFWSDHICPGGGYTHTRLALRPVGE